MSCHFFLKGFVDRFHWLGIVVVFCLPFPCRCFKCLCQCFLLLLYSSVFSLELCLLYHTGLASTGLLLFQNNFFNLPCLHVSKWQHERLFHLVWKNWKADDSILWNTACQDMTSCLRFSSSVNSMDATYPSPLMLAKQAAPLGPARQIFGPVLWPMARSPWSFWMSARRSWAWPVTRPPATENAPFFFWRVGWVGCIGSSGQ